VPTNAEPASVLIIDDHPSVREGLRAIIDGSRRYRVAATASSPEEAVEALSSMKAAGLNPAIVIVDVNLKGRSGIDFVRDSAQDFPGSAFVMISVSLRFDTIVESLGAGAKGYIAKDQDEASMLRVLDAVSRGEIGIEGAPLAVLADNARRLASARSGLERSRYEALTPREKEVFRLVSLNRGLEGIARELGLSVKTVENLKSSIFGKLAIQDRFELYRYALRIGVVEED
jgi:DNA-binding NarL/FixJ family response regulator